MDHRALRLAREVARFATTGTIASLVAIGIFNWLVHWDFGVGAGAWLHDQAITAFLAANTFSIFVAYTLSRGWAFRHRTASGALGGVVPFFTISFASLAIPVACLWFSRNVLELTSARADNLSANAVGLFLGFVTRFVLIRALVFRHHDAVRAGSPATVGRSPLLRQLEEQPET